MKVKYSIESLCLYINRGITPKYTVNLENSIKVLNQKCIRDFRVSLEQARLNDLKVRKVTEEKFLKMYDVLINSTGVGTLGRVAQYYGGNNSATVDSHVTIVRPNAKLVDPVYFGYLMKSKQHLIESFAEGTTGQTELNRNSVKELLVEIIEDLSLQKKIGEFLLCIDKKIELNTQINQTLVEIAQAIFKSWFIDFDPVKAKMKVLDSGGSREEAEIAAMCKISGKSEVELQEFKKNRPDEFAELAHTASLFPSEMQVSELGEIPTGWSICNFSDISRCFDNKRVPLSKNQRQKKSGNIPYYGATSIMDYINDWIFNDVYVLMGEDGSVIKNDGTPFLQYIWGKSWVNNHAHVLQGNKDISTEHLFLILKQTNISAYITGAVQLKINQKNMNSIKVIKGSSEINFNFSTLISHLFCKIRFNTEQNLVLNEIKDSLLHKLLCGEIQI